MFMNLLRRLPFGCNFGNPSIEVATLLGVGEVLKLEELNFPVLFDERDNGDTFVLAYGIVDKIEYACDLRRGIIIV
jgi:hypothetical protein